MYPIPLPPEYQGVDLLADGVFTLEQVCEYLNKSLATLYRWMNAGLLVYYDLPFQGRLIPKIGLRIFLEKGDFSRVRRARATRGRGKPVRSTQKGKATH